MTMGVIGIDEGDECNDGMRGWRLPLVYPSDISRYQQNQTIFQNSNSLQDHHPPASHQPLIIHITLTYLGDAVGDRRSVEELPLLVVARVDGASLAGLDGLSVLEPGQPPLHVRWCGVGWEGSERELGRSGKR